MAANLSQEKIDQIKDLASKGVMNKVIAKKLGVSLSAVVHNAKGVERPFEHRGRKSPMSRSFSDFHREDRDW